MANVLEIDLGLTNDSIAVASRANPAAEQPVASGQASLVRLGRAIALSENAFSLLFAHCNNPQRQRQLAQQIQKHCPMTIHEVVLWITDRIFSTLMRR